MNLKAACGEAATEEAELVQERQYLASNLEHPLWL